MAMNVEAEFEAVIIEDREYTIEGDDVSKNADIILENSCPRSHLEPKLKDGATTPDSGEQNDHSTQFSGIALQYFQTKHGHSNSMLEVQELRRSRYREYSQEQQSDLLSNVMEVLHDLTTTIRQQGESIAALQHQLHHIQAHGRHQQPSNHATVSDVEPVEPVTQPGSSVDAPVNVFEAVHPVHPIDDNVEPVERGWQSESSSHAPANGSGPTYPVPPRRVQPFQGRCPDCQWEWLSHTATGSLEDYMWDQLMNTIFDNWNKTIVGEQRCQEKETWINKPWDVSSSLEMCNIINNYQAFDARIRKTFWSPSTRPDNWLFLYNKACGKNKHIVIGCIKCQRYEYINYSKNGDNHDDVRRLVESIVGYGTSL